MDDSANDIAEAPMPTRRTLNQRRNLPYQIIRFIVFNLRMLKMVEKGHN